MPYLRLANIQDLNGISALIDSVLQEYGDHICLDGAEADLRDISSNYFDRDGMFWVLVKQDAEPNRSDMKSPIIGCHAALANPNQKHVCNFKRLYLAKPFRGTQWGHRLMQIAIDWATESGFERIEFWSDTRFHRAHHFFKKFGFQLSGQSRVMHDSHQPYEEYFFYLNIDAKKEPPETDHAVL